MSEPKPKPFAISKRAVWAAWLRVKANRGAAGVDEQSIAEFERDLAGNLYKLWNRLSSGSYMPPPVRAGYRSGTAARGCSGCRRSRHTARSPKPDLGSLVVTHPFHPLRGERLEVLYVRRVATGRVYVCDGGGGRNVALDEAATDRGSEPAERPLTFDVLVELAVAVAAVGRSGDREAGR